MLENVVETRARDSTLYNKEAKLRRLKRRIEMEEGEFPLVLVRVCTQEYRVKQRPGP
jgi:hypothetical protein